MLREEEKKHAQLKQDNKFLEDKYVDCVKAYQVKKNDTTVMIHLQINFRFH